jgi:hypothetical protein
MRTGITLARKHGSKNFEIVAGTDIPIHQQIADAKKLSTPERVHPKFAELQIWTSDSGITKHLKFKQASVLPSKGEEPHNATPAISESPKESPKPNSPNQPQGEKSEPQKQK